MSNTPAEFESGGISTAGGIPVLGDANLVNALPHPILLINEKDEILFVNSAAEQFFQAGAQLLKGRSIHEYVPFASPLSALIQEVRRKASPINEYDIDISSPKIGARNVVDIFGCPSSDNENEIVLMLHQRNMAQMIERKLIHRQAVRSVSGMASVLAHEIKNPLAGIKGAAQLLDSTIGDEDRNLTRLIAEETDRICKLVDSFGVFGEQNSLVREPVNIHAVLDHVVKSAKAGFGADVTFQEEYDPSLPPIPGDRDLLIQAFLNLVKNACEAIGTGSKDGRIKLSTSFRPGIRLTLPGTRSSVSLPLLISVADNGPGIADEITDNLFDPFVTTKMSGTGLGLSLVAKLIADHGGTVEFDTHPGGTKFNILLPMHTGPVTAQDNEENGQ